MNKRSRLLSFGLPILGLGFLLVGTKLIADNQPVTIVEFPPRQPAAAPRDEAEAFVGAIGVSEPLGEVVQIASQSPGLVVEVGVRVGQEVAEGDLLFRVDDRRAKAKVMQQQSLLAVAEAEVLSLRGQISLRQADLDLAAAEIKAREAQVSGALADLEDRRNLLKIVQSLSDPRAIATEILDSRNYAAQQAMARWQAALAELEESKAGLQRRELSLALLVDKSGDKDGVDLRVGESRVASLRRDLEAAELELELLSTRARSAGRILQVNIRPGEYAPAANSAAGLITMAPAGTMRIRVEIDEIDIGRVSAKARAWASPRGQADLRFEIKFDYQEPFITPKQRLSGRASELIDTRVLPLIYRFVDDTELMNYGRQFDVYIAIEGEKGA